MLALVGNICGNTITVENELLKPLDGQSVTIIIAENTNQSLARQLDDLRTSSKSSWGEDAQSYIEKLRAEDYVF